MKRLTTRQLDALIGVVQDDLEAINNKKLPNPAKEIEKQVRLKVDYLLKPYEDLGSKISKLNEEKDYLEDKMKKAFNIPYQYGSFVPKTFDDLWNKEEKNLREKYKIIKIPTNFEIEKMIYKASSTDFQEIIKSIVTQISKQNEYIEVQE